MLADKYAYLQALLIMCGYITYNGTQKSCSCCL